jgi:hypothetical protein
VKASCRHIELTNTRKLFLGGAFCYAEANSAITFMKTPLFLLSTIAFATLSASAASFQAGDLLVLRLDNGANTLTSAATAGYLDEYTTSGTLVQSVALPTLASGGNDALTFAGNSASEGQLRLSSDGQSVTVIGYNATPGTLNPAGAAPGTINRVIGVIHADGTVDSSTAISASTFTSNPRGVVTDNGSHFWAASGSGNGVFYVNGTGSSATATQLGTAAARTMGIFGGQLYASVANANPGFGLASVGSGLPTSSASLALLNGFPASSSTRSTWGYYMADLNSGVAGIDTAWVADDKTSGGDAPGVEKWTFDGTQWSLSYTISTGTGTGARALAVDTSGSSPVVYVTTTDNKLEKIVDTGASATAQTLITGTGNTFFRGVDFAPVAAPEPQSLLVITAGALLAWKQLRRRMC